MYTKLIAICTIALLLNLNTAAQDKNKTSWYYPELEIIKGKVSGMYNFDYNLSASGCVTGNCKDGTGVFVRAINGQRVKDTTTGGLIHIDVYKGTFGKDGLSPVFEGTYYSRSIPYKLVKDGQRSKRTGQNSNWFLK